MAKRIVFVLHGIGEHGDDWGQPIADLLAKLWDETRGLRDMYSFAERFEVVPLRYDQKFETLRKRWRNDWNSVSALLNATPGVPAAVHSFAEASFAPGTRQSFVTTHLLDLLLYRFVPSCREWICQSVALQIMEALSRNPQSANGEWTLIAHSMGTSVAHDALHGWLSHEWDDVGVPPEGFMKGRALVMLANCSRLLERKGTDAKGWDVYRSRVRPGVSTRGSFHNYLSVAHKLDPVPRPKLFEPIRNVWPSTDPEDWQRYWEIRLSRVTDANVHDFAHYLRDPEVYLRLFELIGSRHWITNDDRSEAEARYRALEDAVNKKAIGKAIKLAKSKMGANADDQLGQVIGIFDYIRAALN